MRKYSDRVRALEAEKLKIFAFRSPYHCTRLTCERAYFLQIKPRTKIAFWPDARAAFWTFPGLVRYASRCFDDLALGIRKVGTFGNYCHTHTRARVMSMTQIQEKRQCN